MVTSGGKEMEKTNVRQRKKIFWLSDSLELPIRLPFAKVQPLASMS